MLFELRTIELEPATQNPSANPDACNVGLGKIFAN